jgi:serine/threonine-protein kinase RIO1
MAFIPVTNTQPQVLDPRTRLVLYKLLNKETLHSIHGCVSTGKEANVYYATTPVQFLEANGVAGAVKRLLIRLMYANECQARMNNLDVYVHDK